MTDANKRVAVLGIGGGGNRVVAALRQLGPRPRLDMAVADTDRARLESLTGVVQIPLGGEWGCEAGCGGDFELGERAAGASVESLREFIGEAALLVVVAGLGGGTGSGGIKVAARLAREASVPAFFVVTLPFSFEGNWRRQQAEKVLPPLREITEAVIVVQNDFLFTTLAADTPAPTAFGMADDVLARGIAGLAAIAWTDWMLGTDFAAIRAILKQRPEVCHLGFGGGNGPERWQDAVSAFLACPLVGGPETLGKADAAVVTLTAATPISVGELQTCLSALQQYFPQNARVVIGACLSSGCQDEIQITGLICHSAASPAPQAATATPAGDPQRQPRTRPKKEAAGQAVQGELPFQEQSAGIFSGTAPTTVNGENLDVPTFQRRGIHLDTGD